MNDEAPRTVLQKMTHRQRAVAPDVPLTASRAVTLAVTRAAQTSVSMTLNVSSIREEMVELDGLLAQLSDDVLIVGVGDGTVVQGLLVCDSVLCNAAVEVQTTGRLSGRKEDPRRITRADAALIEPFFDGLLQELTKTTPRTVLDGWADQVTLMKRLSGPRAAGFVLSDQVYRLMKVTIGLGGGDQQTDVMIALPPHAAVPIAPPKEAAPKGNWAKDFPEAVLAAPACLDAVLHTFEMPLSAATRLEVGQMLPLYGCTVGTVRLVAPDGRSVAKARLGQVAGQIAVRIEEGAKLDLRELPPQPIAEKPVTDERQLAPSE